MATDAGTEEALNKLNGQDLDNRAIVVNEARAREDRSGGGSKRY